MKQDSPEDAPSAFACRQVTMSVTRRGYQLSLSLYDASYRGESQPLSYPGPYQLWGRPLDPKETYRGLIAVPNAPWIRASEKGEYQLVAKVIAPPAKAEPLISFWESLRAA